MKIGICNLSWKWHIWIDCFCSPFLYDWCRVASGWTRCLNFNFISMLCSTHTHTRTNWAESSSCKWNGDDDDTPLFTYTSDFSVHFTGRRRLYGHRIQMICETINAAEWQTSGFMRGTAWTGTRCPHTKHNCHSPNFRSGVVCWNGAS